jgi:seryl-tRNA synthetase
MISTGEIPLTNYYNNEIIDLIDEPKLFSAFTPCFRSEAGAAGRDTRGLIRSHQFNKVEIVKFVNEEDSMEEFEKTVKDAENLLIALEIPYRKVLLCTGDMGFSSRMTYDLEL